MVAKTTPRAIPPTWPRRVTTFLVRGEADAHPQVLEELELVRAVDDVQARDHDDDARERDDHLAALVLQGRGGQVLRLAVARARLADAERVLEDPVGDHRVEHGAGQAGQPLAGLAAVRARAAPGGLGQPPERHAGEPDHQQPQDDRAERGLRDQVARRRCGRPADATRRWRSGRR